MRDMWLKGQIYQDPTVKTSAALLINDTICQNVDFKAAIESIAVYFMSLCLKVGPLREEVRRFLPGVPREAERFLPVRRMDDPACVF